MRSRSGSGEGLRIVVLGYVVRGPLGGLAWHHLQYALGLARLGHDVLFVEDSDDYPSCYDPERDLTDTDPTYGLRFASRAFERIGLGDAWAYRDAHRSLWLGPAAARAERDCAGADLLLNLSGVNPLRRWLESVPVRALIDTDPVFTQIKHLSDPAAMERARAHNRFLTFGELIGREEAAVPDDGLPWQPTRQPVVLDAWPVSPGPSDGAFTTVMQWDSYEEVEHGGVHYGMKSRSFTPYMDLPRETSARLELAVGSPSAPRGDLAAAGWLVRDPLGPTRDPWSYQRYLAASKAEFSVAKHGYVISRSGWFSERSAAYLASGRPVVLQDTGFSTWLPAGRGVLAFTDPEGALAGIDELERHYDEHCAAAREVATEFFDSDRVLSDLLESAHASPSPRT